MTLISSRSCGTPSGWILSTVDSIGMYLEIFGLGQMIDGKSPTSPMMSIPVAVRPCDVAELRWAECTPLSLHRECKGDEAAPWVLAAHGAPTAFGLQSFAYLPLSPGTTPRYGEQQVAVLTPAKWAKAWMDSRGVTFPWLRERARYRERLHSIASAFSVYRQAALCPAGAPSMVAEELCRSLLPYAELDRGSWRRQRG